MSMQIRKSGVLGWGLVLLLGVVAPAVAGETKGPRTGEAAILAALEEKTGFEFIDEPLGSVVDYFKEAHNIEIQIDIRAIEAPCLGTDTPITKSLRNVSLRSALNLILREVDLTWTIVDEVLMITTPEEAQSYLTTRVYDVGKLVTVQDAAGDRWLDFDTLTKAIVGTIMVETWEEFGGFGSMAGLEYRGAAVLIVRQTLDVHEQVSKLLEDLTKVADRYGDEVIPTREKPRPPAPEAGTAGQGFF
jgi:hypothetical protein